MGPNPLRLFLSMMTPIYRQNMNKIGANQLGRFPRKSKDDDGNLSCMNDETADHKSMDEEIDHVSYELEYQKDKVMEQLSTIFKLLNIDSIHDKYIHIFFRIFLNASYA